MPTKKRQLDDEPTSSEEQRVKKQKNSDSKSKEGSASKAKDRKQSPSAEQERNKAVVKAVLGTSSGVKNIQGVLMEDLEVGTGKRAESGKKVKVFYSGKLKSTGKVFDASLKKPFAFRLGRSEVIKGWDIGVNGMCVGGKRRITCPPEKAYGRAGAPPTIPPNSTLIFDVTLVDVN